MGFFSEAFNLILPLAELKEIKIGSATVPVPGFDVQILNEKGQTAKTAATGNIVIKLPLPPGCLPTLWKDDERFKSSYVSEYRSI